MYPFLRVTRLMDIIRMLLHFSVVTLVNLFCSVVRRTRLSPSQPHNLRPVITADVDVGFQSQSDQCDNTQFARSQGLPVDMAIPMGIRPVTAVLVLNSHQDVQDHTMNFLDDQQPQVSYLEQG
jgi:hypothetical protein